MRKSVVLITGAGGEIGHGLISRLVERGRSSIVTLDLNPLEPALAQAGAARVHRLDHRRAPARSDPLGVRDRDRLSSGRVAVDALRVHAGHRASGERRGHAEPARVLAARGRIARAAGHVPVSLVDCRLRAAGCGDQAPRRQGQGGRVQHAATMYGCNKLYCEQLGRYYARFYKQLAAEPQSGRVDFRAVRFPGLISAMTVPSGGTSDYAPEMIHAAAQGRAVRLLRAAGHAHPVHGDAGRRGCAARAGGGADRAATDAHGVQPERVQSVGRRDLRRGAARVSRRRRSAGRPT